MKNLLRSLTAILVLAGAATFSGCSKTTTSKSTGEMVDDAAITTKVKAAFAKDPGVKAMDVTVDTFKGTVQLSGFVDSANEKKRAEEIARTIPGVTKVENKLTLKAKVAP
jgi:osmotically-inducible protein OsmY